MDLDWNWNLGLPVISADAATTDAPSWNWSWTVPPAQPSAAATTGTAAQAPDDGQWTWTWTWTNSAGVAIDVTRTTPCACSWLWNWAWTGDPVAGSPSNGGNPAQATAAPSAAVTQTNSAAANAAAAASSSVTQDLLQPSGAGDAVFVQQAADTTQSASATATVVQSDASNANFITSGMTGSLAQENLVAGDAAATATFTAAQALSQARDGGNDAAAHLEGAWQTIANAQIADASAHASQSGAFNRDSIGGASASLGPVAQRNTVSAVAAARTGARVLQAVSQKEITGGGADQEAEAVQSSTTTQAAWASAQSVQAQVGNTNDVVVPAGGRDNPALIQTNEISSVADAADDTDVTQHLAQEVPAADVGWTAVGEQDSAVDQSGTASSSSQQSGRVNSAGWNGLLAASVQVQDAAAPAVAVTTTVQVVTGSVTSSPLSLAPPDPVAVPVWGPRIPPLSTPVVRTGTGRAPVPPPASPGAPARAPLRSAGTSVTTETESPPAPGCSPLCSLLAGLTAALDHGRSTVQAPTATADVLFVLAAFPSWRLQLTSPAPGRPVVLTPDERPG